MAKHLTDREKKKIIADYVELESYNAVAKKHNVSATTVKNTVLKNNESVKKCEQKKEQNTADILEFMDKKKVMCAALFLFIFLNFKTPISFSGQVFRVLPHHWALLLTNLRKTRRSSPILLFLTL